MLSTVFVSTLLLLKSVSAVEVRFFYSPLRDSCAWGGTNTFPATNLTNNGGVCAYVPSRNRLFACNAGEAICWGFNVNCLGGTTATPGPNQISCGRSNGNQWCCGEGESCTTAPGQINVCIPNEFSNPSENLTIAEARQREYSALPSESIVTALPRSTPSVFSTLSPSTSSTSRSSSRSSSASNASNASNAPGASADASSLNGNTNSSGDSSGISGGAIAGIVVGAIAGTLLIVGLVFWLLKRRRRDQAVGPNGGVYEKPQEEWNTQYAPSTVDGTAPSTQYPHAGYYAGEVYAKTDPESHLPPQEPPHEMPVNTKPQELP